MKKLILLFVFIIFALKIIAQPTYIHRSLQDVYINGMNLAWINFANDLEGFDQTQFTQAVTSIKAAGGNTIRWWIHVDGTTNPVFTNDSVSEMRTSDIDVLKKALDIAYGNGVLVDLCLWSFDMLQSNKTADVIARNTKLLTDTIYTKAYIRNALIPMVKALKDHPGILSWEVFNEPEGMTQFGWTPVNQRVDISYIQRVVNMVAGAIHREAPNALVSNGSQLIRFTSDVKIDPNDASWKNYYSDDRLISAGHDVKGTLDFYMVHYYPGNGSTYNVFNHNASYWNVGKPLIVGEFPANGLNASFGEVQCDKYAYNNGYAGTLAWAYTGGTVNGGLPDCAPALDTIEKTDPLHVKLIADSSFIYPPYVKNPIPDGFAYLGQTDTITIGNLFNWFSKKIDSVHLKFTVDSIKPLANIIITPYDSINTTPFDYLKVIPKAGKAGIYTTTITASDTAGNSIYAPFIFSIVDSTSINRFQYRNVYASSIESYNYLPAYAVDSLQTTRWSTLYKDNQWFLIKLDKEYVLQRMMIHWETAFGRKYSVSVSTDSLNWHDVFTENFGNGGYDKLIFTPVSARFVRLNCIKRATQWGFSTFEIQGFSTKGPNTPPVITSCIPDQNAIVHSPYSYAIPATMVKDTDQGERLYYHLTLSNDSVLPAWVSFIDSSLVLSGIPAKSDTGIYHLKLKVSDLFGASDSCLFNLTVNPNHPPVFKGHISDTVVTYVNTTEIKIPANIATDQDPGDKIAYSIAVVGYSTLPKWVYLNNKTSILEIFPAISDTGAYQFVLIASDLSGNTATDTFKVIIKTSLTSIAQFRNLKDLNIYPNPSKEYINITWHNDNIESLDLTIINNLGQVIITRKIQPEGINNSYNLNVENLLPGLYIVKLQNSKSTINKKVQIIK